MKRRPIWLVRHVVSLRNMRGKMQEGHLVLYYKYIKHVSATFGLFYSVESFSWWYLVW